MPRCPECGIWIWHGRHGWHYLDDNICPGCGAVLRHKGGLSGRIHGNMEVVGHTRDTYSEGADLPQSEVDSSGQIWF